MAANEIHLGDIGTKFRCTIYNGSSIVDVSSASVKQIVFQKPDGTDLTVNASFETDGTDGVIYYLTVSGDLSQIGLWSLQGYIEIATGKFHSDIKNFKVYRNL